MPKVFIRKSSTWPEIKSIFVKKTTGWTEVKNVFLKKLVSGTATWVKVFTKLSLPDTTTAPSIRTTNTGSGSIYDGPVATSPQFLNENLYGKDGVFTNYTSIFGRKFTSGDTSSALTRSTVVTGDLFTSGGGVTTTDRTNLDNKYLFYELTVQNGSSANEIYPISSAIKMIKSYPVLTDMGWTDIEQVGTQLSLSYTIENYYYNKIDPALSYVRWWRSTSTNAGGTLLKEQTISATSTGATSTSRTGTSLYTPVSADIGYYIVAEITGRSSYTDHYGYTDNYAMGSFPTDGVIGSALTFSDVQVRDYYGTDGSVIRNGLDNRDRWPVGTLNRYHWVLDGYDSNTTIRVRYRVYNYSTGRYYKPSTGAIQADTTAGSNAAWDSYNSDGSGNGYISDVSVSGTTATCYDFFDLDSSFFNGGGGTPPTWWVEVELSALRGGPRVYAEGYTGGYVSYYTGKAIDSSISASPSSAGLNADVTISGSLIGTPASPSTDGYPRQYKVTYGDGTNSGWLPVGEYAYGTANPTYSLTKQYSTAGTYTISIDTIPHFEISSTTVTVTTTKVPPTMGTPTISAVGDFVTGQRRLSVPFTAVTNSGPAYQIYWYPGADYAGSAKPPVSASIDGSGTTSPIRDESGPNGIGRYAVWIRSSATTSTTGSTAPSTTLSDWSDLKYVYISGTRTLSYNKNTTDTVTSLPSDSSGTDPWDGWVTTVSSNTPTRTGYTFNGYNTSSDGTSGTNYAAGAAITLTSAVTLYAKWTANTYAVTYYGNNNTGGSVPDAQTKTHGVDLTLRTNVNTLTRTGYTFAGWNTNSSGTGTDYAAGATYSGNTALDLYAKWTTSVTLYTVTFSANGATGSPSKTTATQLTEGGSVTLATIGTMAGGTNRIFGGWRTGTTSGTVYAFGATYTPTSDITLYAYYGTQPTCAAPSLNFRRFPNNNSSSWEYFADYPTPSGAYTEIIGMQYEIYSANSTSGSTVAGGSGTLAYPTGGDLYPYLSSRDGTYWSFLVRSGEGSRVATTSARYGRVRVRMRGIDGVNYPGTYTSPLL